MARPNFARCKGSGRPAQKDWSQFRQQCPFCGRYVYVTPGGYLESHSPGDRTEALKQ